jgi:hypothetical protein
MAATSYAYRTSTGNNVIPHLGTVTLHYPPEDASSGNVNQSAAEVVVGNQIIPPAKYGLDFDQDTSTITVENLSGADWPPQTDVVVSVPRDAPATPDDIKAILEDHEARIAALEGVANDPFSEAPAPVKAGKAKAKK